MTRFRVLVSDPLGEGGVQILKQAGDIEVLVETKLSRDDLKKRLAEVDAVVIRSGTTITGDLLEGNTRLKVIGRAGVGVDNVDVPAATERGIVVMNTPGGNADTTAEHAIALMFAAARSIPQAYAKLKDGVWDRKTFVGQELVGKTLGVLGLGNIGSLVAKRGVGLGMRVLGYDPLVSAERAARIGVELCELDRILREADVVTIHVPLMDKTRNLIGPEQLKSMKKTAILVNAARGGIVDEMALDAALKSGTIAAAALDVFAEEPPAKDHPLLANPKCIFTPHLGASTHEAQEKVALAIAEQVRDFLLSGEVRNAVNAPNLSADTVARIGPYLRVGGKLGRLIGQLHAGQVKRICLRFEGEIAGYDSTPVVAHALKGILETIVEGNVNEINAREIARSRGIDVEVTTSASAEDFVSTVTATLVGDKGETSAAGTVFGKRDPRIVRVNSFLLEAMRAEGVLVMITNKDVPGVVGKLGTIFGARGVNIAQMHVGRTGPDSKVALTVVAVDGEAPDVLLGDLRAVPEIQSVTRVVL